MLVNDAEVQRVGKREVSTGKRIFARYGSRTEISVSRIQLKCLRLENKNEMWLIDLSFSEIKDLMWL